MTGAGTGMEELARTLTRAGVPYQTARPVGTLTARTEAVYAAVGALPAAIRACAHVAEKLEGMPENIRLPMLHALTEKLGALEQDLQRAIAALVEA